MDEGNGHVGNVPAALTKAATNAGYAPSVHNTQPWRWRVLPDRLELRADRSRQLTAADPDGHLLLMSCGTALHHARTALAADGVTAAVVRLPDPADVDLLAVLSPIRPAEVTPDEARLAEAARQRHTDRRPVADEPVGAQALDAIRHAVAVERLDLHVLAPDQVTELAAAADRAGRVTAAQPDLAAELAYWTGRSPAGTGLPDEVLPASQPQTTVPLRDYGREGTLPVGPGHDKAATYAVLFGPDDEPETWLQAGEALSAAWLVATAHGVSVLPFSGLIELPDTRQALRHLLAGLGQPYLVLRLGIAAPAGEPGGAAHTPRLPTAQVVDTSALHGGA
ncbi:MAG TPA: nitroreductase [Pilimelia sp.]|nr:nitroreductase [Pilimelia sp.]